MSSKVESSKIDKQTASIISGDDKGRGRKAGAVMFPRNSLLEALKVAEAIWEHNAGNPYPIMDIASKVGYSPTTGLYRELLRSAQRYGLTNESFTQDLTKTISLTSLGNSLVAPTPEENVSALKRRALETPDLFRVVLSTLQGKIIPPQDSFKNMLIRNHHLDKSDAEACYQILIKNITDLDAAETIGKNTYLRLDKLGSLPVQAVKDIDQESQPSEEDQLPTAAPTGASVAPKIELAVPRVFISHSKNMKILDQIKRMLAFGSFEYEVAVETETTAIPIPEKIFGMMRKCNCAVINVSADEQEKRADGTYAVNQNVLIEIGAAFLQYNRRVILLVDKRVKLPSNLQGLYRSNYEGDELSWDTGMKLQEALTEFRKMT